MISKLGSIFINAKRHSARAGCHQTLLITINEMILSVQYLLPSKSSHTSTFSKLNLVPPAVLAFTSVPANKPFHPRKN